MADTPKPGDPVLAGVTNVVIGNNGLVVQAAVDEARRLGFTPCLLTRSLQGEAREVARVFLAVLDEIVRSWLARRPAGVSHRRRRDHRHDPGTGQGRTMPGVRVGPRAGAGGHADVVVLAAGTDGSDGPTDAAGAVVDPTSLRPGARLGLDARRALAENDSYLFFGALGDLVVTGPTGSNLMDLYVGLVG